MIRVFSALIVLTAIAVPGRAQITWNVTFNDVVNNTNVGFDDATFGAARQSTFTAVLNYINLVVRENGTVDLTVNDSGTDGTGALASAGATFFTSPNGFTNGFVFDHATTGTDPSGGSHDGGATFDFGYTWNSETDLPTGSEFDLFTVALHEVTHTMGFSSLVDENGNSRISGGDPGVFSVYDSFLERGNGTDLFGAGGDFLGITADLTSTDVFFSGANAMAANGGNAVKVFAPGTFNQGSSMSHIDSSLLAVMNPAVARGFTNRAYSGIELGILKDIGWSVIPEPGGFSAMVILTLAASAIRRRRQAARVAAA